MDFQYSGEKDEDLEEGQNACDNAEKENEYHLEIKIESVELTQDEPDDVQLVFIFGDLVNKMSSEGGEGFDGRTHIYTVHSTPSTLSEKLLNVPIMLCVVSLKESKPMGSLLLELSECFANAVKCNDFRSESIKKVFELGEGKAKAGSVKFFMSVAKDVENSFRHRDFYAESTREKLSMQAQS